MQDALGVDAFNVSPEALVADSLFDAYRAADEAAIKKLILSKPIFTELDNQVRFHATLHGSVTCCTVVQAAVYLEMLI